MKMCMFYTVTVKGSLIEYHGS